MKKDAALLLISIFILTSLISCSRSEKHIITEHSFPDADYDASAADIAVAGDTIYTVAGGSVFKAGETEPALTLDYEAEYIASDGASLYIFGGGKVTYGDNVFTLPQSEITSFVCADGTLCWTYNDDNGSKIGYYNTKNGDMISQKPLFGVVCKVIPYTGSKIMIHCLDMSGNWTLYDFDTDSMKTGGIMINALSIFKAAYNSADNAIYMLDGVATGNNMSRYDIATGETTYLTPCDALSLDVVKLLFSGGSAIISRLDGSVKVRNDYTLPDDGITTVTAVITPDIGKLAGEEMRELIDRLRMDYNIELVIIEYNDSDKLKQKQLAGDDDYDLYFATESGLVLDYPIYEPLDIYPQIMEQFDGMLDDIRRLCSHNEKVFGAPFIVSTINIVKGYNAELLERLDIALPLADWTLDDYYNLAVELRRHDCYISIVQPLWLSDYAVQYFDPYGTGTINDDGTVLCKLLEINKKLKKEGLLYNGEFRDNLENVLYDNPVSSHAFVYNRTDVLFKPTFDGERCYSDQFVALMMNIHSHNKNAAANVIAEFLKPGGSFSNPLCGMLYYKDMSVYEVPWLPPNFEEFYADAPEQRDEAYEYFEARRDELVTNEMTDMDEKTAYNYSLYLDCLSHMKLGRTNKEWLGFAIEQERKYINDEQDLDYTVELIYNRAKLIMEE